MAVLSGLLTVMDRAARKAGAKLRRDFNEVQQLQVSRKGPADFVSKADQQAERTLYDELLHARPDWGFLLEEVGEITGDPTKPRWIVDPVDGTSNFLHGIPHFAISIAVQEPKPGGHAWGEISQGLVYNPLTDESFWAEKGRGAWLNERRLRVSARRDLSEALIATGILVSYAYSVAATLYLGGDVFFEAAGILTTFSLAGHWLEMRSRFATGRAVEALLKTAGRLPVNVKFFFEGQEEIGSPDLRPFVAANAERLRADMIFSADGLQYAPDQPQIVEALKGLVKAEIVVRGATVGSTLGPAWRRDCQSGDGFGASVGLDEVGGWLGDGRRVL